jgi:hypothetical protein
MQGGSPPAKHWDWFAVVPDDVIGHSKTLSETCVTHIAPECLGPCPLGATAMPFSITAPTVMHIACVVLRACPYAPCEPDGAWGAQGDRSCGRSEMG